MPDKGQTKTLHTRAGRTLASAWDLPGLGPVLTLSLPRPQGGSSLPSNKTMLGALWYESSTRFHVSASGVLLQP